MDQFKFAAQHKRIDALLTAAVSALPHLPEAEKTKLSTALKEFETFSCPVLWSARDVAGALTSGERDEVLGRFVDDYDCKQSDWDELSKLADEVLSERELCFKVVYSPEVANPTDALPAVFIPVSLAEKFAKQDPAHGDGVALAFTDVMKLDSSRIVSYDRTTYYNRSGETIPA